MAKLPIFSPTKDIRVSVGNALPEIYFTISAIVTLLHSH